MLVLEIFSPSFIATLIANQIALALVVVRTIAFALPAFVLLAAIVILLADVLLHFISEISFPVDRLSSLWLVARLVNNVLSVMIVLCELPVRSMQEIIEHKVKRCELPRELHVAAEHMMYWDSYLPDDAALKDIAFCQRIGVCTGGA